MRGSSNDNLRVLGILGEPLDAVTIEWRVWRTAGVVAGDDARPVRDNAFASTHQPVGALAVLRVADIARRPPFQPCSEPSAQPLCYRRMRLQNQKEEVSHLSTRYSKKYNFPFTKLFLTFFVMSLKLYLFYFWIKMETSFLNSNKHTFF